MSMALISDCDGSRCHLPHSPIFCLSTIGSLTISALDPLKTFVYTGLQLVVVSEKLNMVTDRGRRGSRAWSPMKPPEKTRRYHTSSHTERAPVATTHLSNCMHRICDAYAEHIYAPTRIYLLVSRNRLAVYTV